MSRTDRPRLDLERLKAHIRQEAERRRAAPAPGPVAPAFDWLPVKCRLLAARRLADAEKTAPSLGQFRGPVRWLARAAARLFLYVSQLTTVRQARFNHWILDSVADVAAGMRQLQERLERQEEELRSISAARGHSLPQTVDGLADWRKTS
jgi:hypothetical protein